MQGRAICEKIGVMIRPIAPVYYRNLILYAQAFAKAAGIKVATVSRRVHSDPKFFDQLKAGKVSTTFRKYDEMMAYFDANWPAGVKRPRLYQVILPEREGRGS